MNLILSIEHRFERTPDGAVWTSSLYQYDFWKRYLSVFDSLRVIARLHDVEKMQDNCHRVDGNGVSFVPVPHYVGPKQYLSRLNRVRRVLREAVRSDDAVLLRVGSQLASVIVPILNKIGHPYGVEVVGDPYEVFAPGVVDHPLRPFFRWWFPRQLAHQCASACAAAYVTKNALQRRYPCRAYTVGVSDVELNPKAFVSAPRYYTHQPRRIELVTVGMLSQLYKAPDVLLDSVVSCVRDGMDIGLTIIGDGKFKSELQSRARNSKIADRVRFLGMLPAGDQVRSHLDAADLFVLPSRTEGLPRAMVEAMARALPCIGSNVGGIPELLAPEDMVRPNDVMALASRIKEVVMDPDRMSRMSARNLEKAREYREEILSDRRTQFYRYLRASTESWLESRN